MSDVIEVIGNIPEEDLIRDPSIGIFADEEIEGRLKTYLSAEIEAVSSGEGRTTKLERNEEIARQRQALPPSDSKDTPWEDASNVEPPFALQKTNTIVTKLVNAYRAKAPLFVYEADGAYKKHAEALTRYVQKQIENPYGINLYPKLWSLMYNAVSYGTQFAKVSYDINRMKFNRIGADGALQKVDKIIRSSPDVAAIPFEDFFTRSEWPDLQRAPWCGVRYYKYYHELKQLAQQGFYTNVENVLSNTVELDDQKEAELDNAGIESSGSSSEENDYYAIYEINVFWDADGDGFDEDLIIHYEPQSNTILRAEYNELGTRDYVRLPYIDIPGVLYALGVGDIMLSLQDEAAALHNMRNDSMALSMLPFIITSNASDFGRSMELYPGKVIRTSAPNEDIRIEKFSDIGLSSITAEGLLKEYADNATGASDILSGQDAGGYNRLGAQGTQFLAGQSNSFLDSIADNTSDKFGEIGMLILYQLVKNSDFINLDTVVEADRVLLQQIFALNVEDIPGGIKFRARVASIQDSKQAKQQEATALMQVYTMYGDKMTQIMSQMENPQLQQTPRVLEMVSTYGVGLTKIIEKVLEGFDADNVGDFLPYIRDVEVALQMSDAQKDEQVDQTETGNVAGEAAQAQAEVQVQPGGSGGSDITQGAGPANVQGDPQGAGVPSGIGGEPV